jgi:hypothetical protein
MLAARKKKFQSARRMSRSTASPSEFLIISQPCEYSSVSTRKDWGMRVPAFIMMVPAFMVPNNRASPYVEDQAVPPEQPTRAKASLIHLSATVGSGLCNMAHNEPATANTRRRRVCSAVFLLRPTSVATRSSRLPLCHPSPEESKQHRLVNH